MFVPQIAYITLSDLTGKVRRVIHEHFGEQTFWIVAEVSGHKFYPDRDRHYFDLVEKIEGSNTEAAKVKANSWEQGSRQIAAFERVTGQRFGDGLQILACVKVNYHIVYGLSLTMVDIDPNFTLGNLERQRKETLQRLLQFNADCVRLEGERYVTRNQGIVLKRVIQRIALIGSPKSEGYTDFIHTIETNPFRYRFTIDYYYSSVQGVNAEQELVDTLLQVYERSKSTPYDCVVITRGGGAKTDFLVFDTYSLSRVVARFPIPVITGIGHHKDVSIVDLMAHTQTKTPTKAAEYIIAHNRGFEENVLRFQQRIIIRTQQLLAGETRRIDETRRRTLQRVPAQLSERRDELNVIKNVILRKPPQLLLQRNAYLFRQQQVVMNAARVIVHRNEVQLHQVYTRLLGKPKEIASHKRSELSQFIRLLGLYCSRTIRGQHVWLEHQQAMMRVMSPQNIMKKGFAIVSKGERIIVRADDIHPGDEITITLDQNDIISTVNQKSDSHGKYDL